MFSRNFSMKSEVDTLRRSVLDILQDRVRHLGDTSGQPPAPKVARIAAPSFDEPQKAIKYSRDNFLAEMVWMQKDFQAERHWKKEQLKKMAKEVVKKSATLLSKKENQIDIQTKLVKIANGLAKDVEKFWKGISDVVIHRRMTVKSAKASEDKNRKLGVLMDRTERYADKVAKEFTSMPSSGNTSAAPSAPSAPSEAPSDEGTPNYSDMSGTDDESALDREEGSLDSDELQAEEEAERDDLLADADRPIEEILAEMQAAEQDTSESSDSDAKEVDKPEILDRVSAELREAQPTGITLQTTRVTVKVPFLLRAQLREYQMIGLEWLATLHDKNFNGILADEMGLGKTLQTISLLAHLACTQGNWGPHLIVVPTSVLLNWELELKKFLPAFKVLCYFGSAKERKQKRVGWSRPNAFHVCLVSYALVLQDAVIFRRRKWHYLILDEAQHIKNFKSQRWQTLLTFNTARRLLLTGTPLQNDLMELWSLLHFLTPSVFGSHSEFKDWFSAPLTSAIQRQQVSAHQELVNRLHGILRPFLLRRLKRDVEKQMPSKYEHVLRAPLSRRQRILYDEFMGLRETKRQLENQDFLGLMNVLMQLRKVCNHPDLFEPRQVQTPFHQLENLKVHVPGVVAEWLDFKSMGKETVQISGRASSLWGNVLTEMTLLHYDLIGREKVTRNSLPYLTSLNSVTGRVAIPQWKRAIDGLGVPITQFPEFSHPYVEQEWKVLSEVSESSFRSRTFNNLLISLHRSRDHSPLFGSSCITACSFVNPFYVSSELTPTLDEAVSRSMPWLRHYFALVPRVLARPAELHATGAVASLARYCPGLETPRQISAAASQRCVHALSLAKELGFPDRWFVEWDCGKLRVLAKLLARLYSGGHKCILFTQMSKMLDILEYFVNLHGYTYVRLDGSTKVERRQFIVDQFNKSPKLFLFIASTRSGGVGINLTSADTVIFYDSDWNPAMDKQAMDRCHRIGQTREVNIYRLISESTIEENIFKKQLEKRQLDEVVIDGGSFTPDALQKRWSATDVLGLLGEGDSSVFGSSVLWQQQPKPADVEMAMTAVEDQEDVIALSAAMKEDGAKINDTDDFVNKEEEAFNKLPAIIKFGVRLFENLLPEEDSDIDEDDVEVKMGGWESESDRSSDNS